MAASKSGRQQRPAFSDREPTLIGIPKIQRGLDLAIEAMSANDFRWRWAFNGQPVPSLTNGWLEKAEAACPGRLTGDTKKQLATIVEKYLHQRFAIATSVSHRDLVSKIEKISKTARALQDAIEIYDHGGVLAWRVLEEIDPQNFKRDDVYPVITQLNRRGHVAIEILTARSAKNQSTFGPQRVWEELVTGLLGVFEMNDWAVTIAKSKGEYLKGTHTRHPSGFVNFAWIVMTSIPAALREHNSSPWTLAEAAAAVRAKLRKQKRGR